MEFVLQMGAIKRLFIWNKMIEMPLWMSGMKKEPLQRSAYNEKYDIGDMLVKNR
jgi:hypothetical protein